jgi:hypothetical protein
VLVHKKYIISRTLIQFDEASDFARSMVPFMRSTPVSEKYRDVSWFSEFHLDFLDVRGLGFLHEIESSKEKGKGKNKIFKSLLGKFELSKNVICIDSLSQWHGKEEIDKIKFEVCWIHS